MKRIMRYGIYFAIYLLFSRSSYMVEQHSLWCIIPITIGIMLIELYAINWDKFNKRVVYDNNNNKNKFMP